uniref:Uncharacterized protein n=1 Tax=Xanthomonas phage fSU1 TaxID=3238781 RepID=A0AB39CEZ7_9VIRU
MWPRLTRHTCATRIVGDRRQLMRRRSITSDRSLKARARACAGNVSKLR